MRPKIYSYLDYRQYLVDVQAALQKENRRFSKREFGRIAKSPSPNYLQFLKDRKLYINKKSLNAISKYLLLSPKEKRYFEALVAFDHAKTHEEKDKYFRHIVSTREYGPFKELQEEHYSYLSHWYMPVIRELVTSPLYTGRTEWIAEQIIPPISEAKARKGIKLLEKLGLIYWSEEEDRWVQKDNVLSTPSEVASIALIKYYKNILKLAKDGIEKFSPSERDYRGVTIGISDETYKKLKKHMEAFWKQIMDTADESQEMDRVYHLGMFMLPMSSGGDESDE